MAKKSAAFQQFRYDFVETYNPKHDSSLRVPKGIFRADQVQALYTDDFNPHKIRSREALQKYIDEHIQECLIEQITGEIAA